MAIVPPLQARPGRPPHPDLRGSSTARSTRACSRWDGHRPALDSVGSGGGWLIFALPPAEVAVHPTEDKKHHQLYLLCEDIEATTQELERRGVQLKRPFDEPRWGRVTEVTLPSSGQIALYQPKHLLANAIGANSKATS